MRGHKVKALQRSAVIRLRHIAATKPGHLLREQIEKLKQGKLTAGMWRKIKRVYGRMLPDNAPRSQVSKANAAAAADRTRCQRIERALDARERHRASRLRAKARRRPYAPTPEAEA